MKADDPLAGIGVHVGSDRVLDELMDKVSAELQAKGCAVSRPERPSLAELHDGPDENAVLVVTSRTAVTKDYLSRHPSVRGVVFLSSGVNSIDIPDATRRGIVVANGATPENQGSMAEATVMLAIALLLRLPERVEAFREERPRPAPSEITSRTLRGATVGLIGFGRIAKEVCRRLEGWGVERILCHTRKPQPKQWPGVTFASLPECLQASHVVSIHLPLTAQTANLVDAQALSLMREDAVLINTSRGGIVDEGALAQALRTGRLAGAAIDTFDIEPAPTGNPLRSCPNVILTDHVIGHTRRMYDSLVAAAVQNVERILRGAVPEYIVNPQVRIVDQGSGPAPVSR